MKNYNSRYGVIQGAYWAIYCALIGYASVYLLRQGFSNTVIGSLMSLTSVAAFVLQPVMGSFADSHIHIELRKILNVMIIMTILLTGALLLLNGPTVTLMVVFFLIVTIFLTEQPFINALGFIFKRSGYHINMGATRAFGSVAYGSISLLLGYGVDKYGAILIPISYLVLDIILIIFVNMFKLDRTKEEKDEAKQLSLMEFALKYKTFMIVMGGVIFVYITHTIINTFMIQILTPIGGTEKHMGIAIFIGTCMEIPIMFSFDKIKTKISIPTALRIGSVVFLIKHTLTYLATSVTMFFIAQVTQMFGYGLFQIAIVEYANEQTEKQDVNKGQSFVTMAITSSSILANLSCGILLDKYNMSFVLLLGVLCSFIGALLVWIGTNKKGN